MLRLLVIFPIVILAGIAFAEDAIEAAGSCIVIHENSESDGDKSTTCFENISLERTSFESGVCQWKTEEQAAQNVQTTTQFVPYCPASYAERVGTVSVTPDRRNDDEIRTVLCGFLCSLLRSTVSWTRNSRTRENISIR